MNPPFSSDGTTATHSAEPSTSSGIPVSGADSISLRTVAAAWTRSSALLVSFFSSSPKASVESVKANRNTTVFFIIPQLYRKIGERLILKDIDAVRIRNAVPGTERKVERAQGV